MNVNRKTITVDLLNKHDVEPGDEYRNFQQAYLILRGEFKDDIIHWKTEAERYKRLYTEAISYES